MFGFFGVIQKPFFIKTGSDLIRFGGENFVSEKTRFFQIPVRGKSGVFYFFLRIYKCISFLITSQNTLQVSDYLKIKIKSKPYHVLIDDSKHCLFSKH